MDDLLGEFDDSSSHLPRPSKKAKTTLTEKNRRSRLSSPPLPRVDPLNGVQSTSTILLKQEDNSSSPIRDNSGAETFLHHDIQMFDASDDNNMTIPTSNKRLLKLDPGSDNEEELEVKPAHGLQIEADNVNISANRISQISLEHVQKKTTGNIKPEPIDSSAWKSITAGLNVQNEAANTVPYGSLDQSEYLEDDGSLRFFWMDYTEVNGSLCLFGKVRIGIHFFDISYDNVD